jgi:uncharacterized protein YdbL (DUF1318 family)
MKTMLWTMVCGLLVLSVVSASAQDLGKAQEQMKKRLPEVAQLKTQKVVGETSAGYLALVQANAPDAVRKVVEAENADRKTIYTAIAAKTGSDADRVGQQRGKEIADRAAPGVMLQRDDGTWHEKK